MNQYPFIPFQNPYPLIEEIKQLSFYLKKINEKLDKIVDTEKKNYLEKDDNYYII